jgi:hypothetical protein
MRTILLTSIVVGAMVFGSCTRNESNKIAEGATTTAELKLHFRPNELPAAAQDTRATSDPNGTTAEAEIKTADVFIYTDAGAYLSHTHLTASQFTQLTSTATADVWETTTPIPTTTGARTFLVGVNLPTAAATSLENKTLTAASTTIQTIARADITTLPAGGIPMFSEKTVTATMQTNSTLNKVTVNVKRIVAKVTVERSTAMTQEGTPGTLGTLEWVINNQNSKYYLMQGTPTTYPDPNWTAASYLASDFADAADSEYVAVNNGPQSPVSNYTARYAVENTSDQKTKKELTRVTVRATFIPAQWVTSYTQGSGTVTRTTNSNTTPTTFYTVTPSLGADTEYFQNQTDANNYATDKGSTASTFTGGYCYWNVFLNKARTGEVLRNDFYKLNITRVVAPGNNSPALTDPNNQPSTDTSVTADVDVLYWNAPVQDNVDLVP